MVEYRIPIANVLSAVVLLLCYVIALIVIIVRAERKARVFGVAGVIVLFLGTVLDELNANLGPWLAALYPGSSVYNAGTIVVATVSVIGMLLMVLAIVAARRAARKIRRSS
jgi:hypothetical protein